MTVLSIIPVDIAKVLKGLKLHNSVTEVEHLVSSRESSTKESTFVAAQEKKPKEKKPC